MGMFNCELTSIGRGVLIDMGGFLLFIYVPVCKADMSGWPGFSAGPHYSLDANYLTEYQPQRRCNAKD
jgi:hypothetical protein